MVNSKCRNNTIFALVIPASLVKFEIADFCLFLYGDNALVTCTNNNEFQSSMLLLVYFQNEGEFLCGGFIS